MRKYLRQGVITQSALAFTATMLPSVFFFIFHFALSRQLGVERYGTLSSLISLLIVTSIPAGIAATVVMKYTAEFRALGDVPRLRSFVFRSLQLATIGALLAVAIAMLAADSIAGYLHISDIASVRLTGLVLGLSLVIPVLRGVLQGSEDYLKLAVSTTIDGFGRAFFGIGLVYAGFGVRGAVGGIAIAVALSLIYSLVVVVRPLRGERSAVTIDARRLAQSSAGVAMAAVFGTVLGFVDVPMVKHFFNAEDAGLYGAASLAGKMVLYALGFVPILVIPKAAARIARGEPTPIVLTSALAATAAVSLPALIIFGCWPQLVLRILTGSAFLAAAPLLFKYGVAMALLAGSGALVSYNIAVHKYHFLIPYGIATVGEIIGIQMFHDSLSQVLTILVATNAVGFFGSLVLAISLNVGGRVISVPKSNAA